MAVQVIRAGSSVRVIVEARGIADTEIVAGFLIITYTDGTTENAGYVGGGTPPPLTIPSFAFNDATNSQYLGAL